MRTTKIVNPVQSVKRARTATATDAIQGMRRQILGVWSAYLVLQADLVQKVLLARNAMGDQSRLKIVQTAVRVLSMSPHVLSMTPHVLP